MSITWRLSNNGFLLEVFEVEEATRKMKTLASLKCQRPMSEESARKYVENNYPRNGTAVTLAAEALGLPSHKKK